MPERPQAGSAAAGSDADAKEAKPRVHVSRHAIMIPPNTKPESPKLSRNLASHRAARKAEAAATRVVHYKEGDYAEFAKPFEAAVASACAQWRRPVTLVEVITAMTDMTGKVKIGKGLKHDFVWKGFTQDRWGISRIPGAGYGLVAFQKGCTRDKYPGSWRFSPSPAARRPLAELGKLSK
jgi:hypothetical protein